MLAGSFRREGSATPRNGSIQTHVSGERLGEPCKEIECFQPRSLSFAAMYKLTSHARGWNCELG
jgi:hypothetical protein